MRTSSAFATHGTLMEAIQSTHILWCELCSRFGAKTTPRSILPTFSGLPYSFLDSTNSISQVQRSCRIPMTMQDMLNRLGNGNKKRMPSRRNLTNDSNSGVGANQDNKNLQDCSWCDEFDRGPCGVPFRLWMQCCDFHPEEYPTVCKIAFQNFHQCLEREEAASSPVL